MDETERAHLLAWRFPDNPVFFGMSFCADCGRSTVDRVGDSDPDRCQSCIDSARRRASSLIAQRDAEIAQETKAARDRVLARYA